MMTEKQEKRMEQILKEKFEKYGSSTADAPFEAMRDWAEEFHSDCCLKAFNQQSTTWLAKEQPKKAKEIALETALAIWKKNESQYIMQASGVNLTFPEFAQSIYEWLIAE